MMAQKQKIFVAYCYAEKKWFDRVESVLAPLAYPGTLVVWDERKLGSNRNARTELPILLESCTIAVIMVSEFFLESDFIRREKLPAMLKQAGEKGLAVRWVLATHCLYQSAGFDPALALNDLDRPLDALCAAGRDAVVAGIGFKLRELAGIPEPPPPPPPPPVSEPEARPRKSTKRAAASGIEPPAPVPSAPAAPSAPPPEPLPPSPSVLSLGEIIESRQRTIAGLQRLSRWLLQAAPTILLVAVGAVAISGSSALFLLIAGFGVWIAALAFALRRRLDFFGQNMVRIRYLKTGLADETLPDRQRQTLRQGAEEILGRA
ncbi:MAG: hypothetical protein QOE70_5631 [Chthoniobacter sp.]|jgi:hypothetical protein|nr:hypothetical protein [Chthoniobacter sp.]